MIRLGYAGLNHTLRPQSIFTDRTARVDTIKSIGIKHLEELFAKNLQDLLRILEWNIAHNITYYRASSELAPHITNTLLMKSADRKKYKHLVYSLHKQQPLLQKIGRYIRENGIRLNFHPGLHIVLNSPNPQVLVNSLRDLWMHIQLIELMGLGPESIIVLHGGGMYGDKSAAMQRWVAVYNKLPLEFKKRIVLENDETNYSIADVLKMSALTGRSGHQVPVVFDLFHYYCYNTTILRHRNGGAKLLDQPSIEEIMPLVLNTWSTDITPEMHLSEQKPGGPLGAHSDYISKVPPIFAHAAKKYKRSIDLMLESKMNEKSLLRLLA